MAAVLCFSTIMILYGIICIFFKDLAWELNKFSNDLRGQVSERTDAWETMMTITGIGAIILSIVLIIWGNSVS